MKNAISKTETISKHLVEIDRLLEQIGIHKSVIHRMLRGKTATITSDYNGQPHGSSRPSMKGKEMRIGSVHIDNDEVHVRPSGQRCYLPLSDVDVHW